MPRICREIYLRQYFILREHRSRGIGRTGITLLESEAFPPGASGVIDVLIANPRGERLWQSLGFAPYAVNTRKMN